MYKEIQETTMIEQITITLELPFACPLDPGLGIKDCSKFL